MTAPLPAILRRVQALGHKVFADGPFDLNWIFERPPGELPGARSALCTVAYLDRLEEWRTVSFPCSTVPGPDYLEDPMNAGGTACLELGQYPKSHAVGLHRGRPAMEQVGPVRIRRDLNRDRVLGPMGPVIEGVFAINFHDGPSRLSAACPMAEKRHVELVLDLMVSQRKCGHGTLLTMTLIPMVA